MGASISTESVFGLGRRDDDPVRPYFPTVADARLIHAYLSTKLPSELALEVLEHAEYWSMAVARKEAGPPIVVASSGDEKSSMILRTRPIGSNHHSSANGSNSGTELLRPVRKVIINTSSKDQGWSSADPSVKGTREGSSSWISVSLIRKVTSAPASSEAISSDTTGPSRATSSSPLASPPLHPAPADRNPIHWRVVARTRVLYNLHAVRDFTRETTVFTWQEGHPIIDEAVQGDRYVLYAHAQYPGWRCEVEDAEMGVFTMF